MWVSNTVTAEYSEASLDDASFDADLGRLVALFQVADQAHTLRCVSSLREMAALRSAWLGLEKVSSETRDYFQTFDWCYNWVTSFTEDQDHRLRIYVLERGTDVIMVWPFMVSSAGFGGVRIMEMIGEPMCQYANILFDPKSVDAALGKKAWSHIKADQQADAVYFKYFPAEGLLSGIIGSDGFDEIGAAVSSYLDYSQIPSWEVYEASFSKSQRKQRRSRLRKLEAQGRVDFQTFFHNDARFSSMVETSIDLKREWLKDTAKHSQSLFSDTAKQFLARLGSAHDCTDEGAMVHVLSLDDKPIGIEIGMLRKGHYYAFLGAIDLQWRDLSPGKIQMEFSQKWGFESGIDSFDYLCDPSGYKSSWTNATADVKTRYVPLTLVGSGYCNLWKARLRPALREAYHYAPENVRRSLNRLLEIAGKGGN